MENKHQPWLHSVRSLLYCNSLRLTLDFTTSQVHSQLQAGTPRCIYQHANSYRILAMKEINRVKNKNNLRGQPLGSYWFVNHGDVRDR